MHVFLFLLIISFGVRCAEIASPQPAPAVDPIIAPDPKIAEILNSLGDNSSALLTAFKVTGELSETGRQWEQARLGPLGRDWCPKMLWAPERQRALFCGANHNRPRFNDVWEYDLPSNTWACLFSTDPDLGTNEGWKDVQVKDGIALTPRGGPAVIAHQWWQITYDPALKSVVFLNYWPMIPAEKLDSILKAGYPKRFVHDPPVWSFDPAKKCWAPIIVNGTKPPPYGYSGAMEYIPDLGGEVYYYHGEMWLFDSRAKTWKDLQCAGSNKPPHDAVMAYDGKNKIIIAYLSNYPEKTAAQTYHYSVAGNKWEKIPDSPEMPVGFDAATVFGYDPIGEVFLLSNGNDIWSYSDTAQKWTKLEPKGPPPDRKGRVHGYFDPARNVLVVQDNTGAWIYRYKQAKK